MSVQHRSKIVAHNTFGTLSEVRREVKVPSPTGRTEDRACRDDQYRASAWSSSLQKASEHLPAVPGLGQGWCRSEVGINFEKGVDTAQ